MAACFDFSNLSIYLLICPSIYSFQFWVITLGAIPLTFITSQPCLTGWCVCVQAFACASNLPWHLKLAWVDSLPSHDLKPLIFQFTHFIVCVFDLFSISLATMSVACSDRAALMVFAPAGDSASVLRWHAEVGCRQVACECEASTKKGWLELGGTAGKPPLTTLTSHCERNLATTLHSACPCWMAATKMNPAPFFPRSGFSLLRHFKGPVYPVVWQQSVSLRSSPVNKLPKWKKQIFSLTCYFR